MHDFVLALHLLGLMLGAGGGIPSGIIADRAKNLPPEEAATLRALGPKLAHLSAGGLVLLWLSGLALVVMAGGPSALPGLFWIKAIFIVTLTLAVIGVEWTYAQIKAGKTEAAKRLPLLGPIAGGSALLAMASAAFAFH